MPAIARVFAGDAAEWPDKHDMTLTAVHRRWAAFDARQ